MKSIKRFIFKIFIVFVLVNGTLGSLTSMVMSPEATNFFNSIEEYFLNGQNTYVSITGNSVDDIPEYDGENAFIDLNDGVPHFTEKQKISDKAFEKYSRKDIRGRCQVAFVNVSTDTMPGSDEERGEIGMIKPSGWHTYNFGELVEGNYLYNRCHLVAWCLAGENANDRNLITGTRYMNLNMEETEVEVARYCEETGNHVLYRVTPDFRDKELVCRGLQIEAYSLEDNGAGLCKNIYYYNVQPGVAIDYLTGEATAE